MVRLPLIPGRHVAPWKQRDLQDFGATHYFLLADSVDCLSCDSVDLVEGVRTKVSVVCSTNEHQQVDWLLTVSNQLQTERNLINNWETIIFAQMAGK